MLSIAVLMATFNGGDFLMPQLKSIQSQLNVDFDIYIRDDGSSDATNLYLKNLYDFPNIYVLNDGVFTGSPAGNFFKLLSGINLDLYDFVSFSDQDDIWFPEKLAAAISTLLSNNSDCYSSDLIAFDNNSYDAWYLRKNVKKKKYDYIFQGASAGCTYVFSSGAAQLVLDVIGELVNDFPKGHSHDWLIYAICRSHGLKWVHDERAFIAYRQHGANSFGAMPGFRGLLQRFMLAKNGWYREQIQWNRQFLLQTDDELRVLNALQNFKLTDRLYLISQVSKFRRSEWDCFLLAILLLFGLI